MTPWANGRMAFFLGVIPVSFRFGSSGSFCFCFVSFFFFFAYKFCRTSRLPACLTFSETFWFSVCRCDSAMPRGRQSKSNKWRENFLHLFGLGFGTHTLEKVNRVRTPPLASERTRVHFDPGLSGTDAELHSF